MLDYIINLNLKKRKLKLDLLSYDYVLEYSTCLTNPQEAISVPIAGDLNENLVIVAQQNGLLKVVKSSDLKLVYTSKVFKTNSGINDLKKRLNLENQILICSNDSQLILSDLETRKKLIDFNRPSRSSFTNLEFFDSSIFSSANLDGQILLFDIRLDSKKPVQLINTNHLHKRNEVSNQITGLVFNYLRYLYSSNDKYIKIFDLRFNKDSNKFNLNKSNRLCYVNRVKYSGFKNESFTSLAIDNRLNLYASCTDNKIYSYDHQALIGNQFNSDSIKCFEGVSVTNFTRIKILNNLNLSSSMLISGSNDAECVIWSLQDSKTRFVNYPAIVLPHILEEVSVVLCDDNTRCEIFTLDDGNNVYKWILNSKLNNQTKYKKGRKSECCSKKKSKPFSLNANSSDSSPSPEKRMNRKRFLSTSNNFEHKNSSLIKKPFKRANSMVDNLI